MNDQRLSASAYHSEGRSPHHLSAANVRWPESSSGGSVNAEPFVALVQSARNRRPRLKHGGTSSIGQGAWRISYGLVDVRVSAINGRLSEYGLLNHTGHGSQTAKDKFRKSVTRLAEVELCKRGQPCTAEEPH